MLQINQISGRKLRRGCALALVLCCTAAALALPATAARNNQVASGHLHYLAIKADGTLWAFGSNFDGQLGNGGSGNDARKDKPIKVLENVVAADGGSDHTLALRSDGSLWAWGGNSLGQLGDGTRTNSLAPKKVMEGVKSIAASSAVSAAVKADGTLWTWGCGFMTDLGGATNRNGIRTVPEKVMDNVATVATNGSRFFAVKTDGTLWAWGANEYGELGNGKTAKQPGRADIVQKPFQVMDGVKDVAAGDSHTLVLKKDGTVWAFGSNSAGQLGDGNITHRFRDNANADRLKPVQVMDGVKAIAAGGYHSLAIKKDNTLWAWGSSLLGQLDRTGGNQPVPRQVLDNVAAVASDNTYSVAMKQDGSLWYWRSSGMMGAHEESGVPKKMW